MWLLAAVATACGSTDSGGSPPTASTPAQPVTGFADTGSQTTAELPDDEEVVAPEATYSPPSQLPAPNPQATPRGRLDSEYTLHYRAGDEAKLAGDYETAVKEYTEAINIIPDITRAFTIRGETYLYLGKFEEAIDDFEAAMIIDETVVSAYAGRSLAYELIGETDKARQDFEYSLTIGMDRDVLDRFLKFKLADIREVLEEAGLIEPQALPASN
jgi:tetratricopeptide (TPR) repeat protein